MRGAAPRLDYRVEILRDDQGRIVLLPDDHRNPLRLHPRDWPLIARLRSENCSADDGDEVPLSKTQEARLTAIVATLDRQGLLFGRGRPPGSHVVQLKTLTQVFDKLARVLTVPFAILWSAKMRGRVLGLASLATIAALGGLWWVADGRIFTGLVTPTWWLGLLIFLIGFPLVHEFSHAFAARLFGFRVTSVGILSHGGLRWSPFVEVRHAVLCSRPYVRVWMPLIGVICNLVLALLAGAAFVLMSPGSLHGAAGILVGLLHVRVLVDGGFSARSDATQALRLAKEFDTRTNFRLWWFAIRGGYVAFALATIAMLARSIGTVGAAIHD